MENLNVKNSVQNNLLPLVLGGSLTVAGILFIREKIHDFQERRKLTLKRVERQKQRNAQFDQIQTNFPSISKESLAILQLDFEDLREKLQTRELTAKKVLEAYLAKSIAVTREFNCITEFVPQMWEWADNLDKLESVKGPLHGIPICIKDDHNIKGMDSTLGLSINLDKPAKNNAAVVEQLINAGALPFCKTNVPQTLYSSASHNPIFGTTLNPLNKKLSPGGSSSGTACLVGAGGAPFGTGSDIGGSLRLPAHFCGLCTLKPTIGRISGQGVVQCFEGVAGYVGVTGILTPRAKTLALIFQILTANSLQNKMDPLTVPLDWDDENFQSKKPLRIGYSTSLPLFPAMGDTPQTVLEAKQALEKLGHILMPFDLPDNAHIVEVYGTLAEADGGNQNYRKLKHDQVSPVANRFIRGRGFFSYIFEKLEPFLRTRTPREIDGNGEGQRSEILWNYLQKQENLKYHILDKMQANELDLLLIPAYPFPALPIEDAPSFAGTDIYISTWNLVNFPCGIVPFGKESGNNIQNYDDQGDHYLKRAKEGAKMAKGIPIGLQIVGKPFKEEIVLRILVELDQHKNC